MGGLCQELGDCSDVYLCRQPSCCRTLPRMSKQVLCGNIIEAKSRQRGRSIVFVFIWKLRGVLKGVDWPFIINPINFSWAHIFLLWALVLASVFTINFAYVVFCRYLCMCALSVFRLALVSGLLVWLFEYLCVVIVQDWPVTQELKFKIWTTSTQRHLVVVQALNLNSYVTG